MDFTLAIIVVTCIISLAALSNENLMNKLILWPRRMDNPSEYYRLLTSGFIHENFIHLGFNMYTLYAFGSMVQLLFAEAHISGTVYLVLYLSAIIVSSLPSFLKNRNNSFYRSLGASGGVSSILFFTIYYFPWAKIEIIPIPFGIPSVIFGALYLVYEFLMGKRGVTNINHDAHFWGAVYGLFFAFIVDPNHGSGFLNAITHPQW